ncbi:MAG: methyltransferase [Aestuariivirga sp.]
MQITIEHLNWRGEGVGDGQTFRNVLAGETVDPATGQVVQASPERIAPFCKYFVKCGGCQLQHWQEAPYRAWKKTLVASALQKRGLDFPVGDIIDAHGAGRRRVSLHVRRWDGVVTAGFMAARSHDLIDIDQCPILVPALLGAPEIARKLGAKLGDCDVSFTAADNGLDVTIKAERKIADEQMPRLAGLVAELNLARLNINGNLVAMRVAPIVSIGKALVQVPPGSFLQATKLGGETLANLVVAALGKSKSVADLFCGVGPFAFRVAEQAKVTAVDSDKQAIAALAQAARLASGLKPLKAEARDLMREPLVANELKEFDAVVFDPPRAGAEAQAKQLAKSAVKTIVAVSCDPASFARDAEILMGGGYKIRSLTAVDQFKWTSHVEIVGSFSR